MNLHRLRLFHTVVECDGFSNAAKHLHLSQQAVSSQVAQLENSLGFALFIRQGRNIRLTAEGRQMYERAARLLNEAASLERWAAQVRQRQKHTVSILSSSTPGAYVVPSVLSLLQERFPKIDVSLRLLRTPEIPAVLPDIDLLDFVVFVNEMETDHLRFEPLARDTIWVLVHRDHPLARIKGSVSIEQLAIHPIVLRRGLCDLRQHLLETFEKSGIEPKIAYVGSLEECRTAVTHGYGVTYLSNYSVHELVGTGVLRRLDVVELRHYRTVYFGLRPGHTLSEPAAHMLQLVRDKLAELERQARAIESGSSLMAQPGIQQVPQSIAQHVEAEDHK